MINRRLFLCGLPISVIPLKQSEVAAEETVGTGDVIAKLETQLRMEFPDITSIEVSYDAANRSVPFMMAAMRV
jgi:hypothetical protein